VKDVDKKVKYLTALAIVALAIGVFLVLPPALATSDEQIDTETAEGPRRWGSLNRLKVLIYILRNGEPIDLEATVVALQGRILVVEEDGALINVNMPWRWIADGETMGLHDLLDGDPFGEEDAVTISALRLQMTRESHIVTAYFAYKVMDGDSAAQAVLPFNIET
jgi:hypothetical protein